MKPAEPKTTKQFTLTIDVESDRDAGETVVLFQKFFDFYHPSLKAVVRKQVTGASPVAAPKKAAPAAVEEDLL